MAWAAWRYYKLKIVAVTNIKGGVGKTTTAVNLAYLSASGGRSTVLWDLDPQGAATYTLKCEPNERSSAKKQEFVAEEGWTDVTLLPFFSMVARRKSLHAQVIASTRAQFSTMLATEVPYSSEIERMTERRAPLPAFSPRSAVGLVYAALWAEVEARMGPE
jgi:cellulose biosynthesis protein BcsQ